MSTTALRTTTRSTTEHIRLELMIGQWRRLAASDSSLMSRELNRQTTCDQLTRWRRLQTRSSLIQCRCAHVRSFGLGVGTVLSLETVDWIFWESSAESSIQAESQSPSQATRAHRAALISVSVALSQTPAEVASPRTRG